MDSTRAKKGLIPNGLFLVMNEMILTVQLAQKKQVRFLLPVTNNQRFLKPLTKLKMYFSKKYRNFIRQTMIKKRTMLQGTQTNWRVNFDHVIFTQKSD